MLLPCAELSAAKPDHQVRNFPLIQPSDISLKEEPLTFNKEYQGLYPPEVNHLIKDDDAEQEKALK